MFLVCSACNQNPNYTAGASTKSEAQGGTDTFRKPIPIPVKDLHVDSVAYKKELALTDAIVAAVRKYSVDLPANFDGRHIYRLWTYSDSSDLSKGTLSTSGDHYSVIENSSAKWLGDNRAYENEIPIKLPHKFIGLGVVVRNHCEPRNHYFNMVEYVAPGSTAERAGIRVGDTISIECPCNTYGHRYIPTQINTKLIKLYAEHKGRRCFIDTHLGEISYRAVPGYSFYLIRNGKDTVHLKFKPVAFANVCIRKLPNGIGVIKPYSAFGGADSSELRRAVEKLSGCRSLILDLRGYTSNNVNNAVALTSMLISDGPLFTIFKHDYSKAFSVKGISLVTTTSDGELHSDYRQPYCDARRVVVLVDSTTAFMGELIAGCLQDHAHDRNGNPKITVIGENTYGWCNGVQDKMVKSQFGQSQEVTIVTTKYVTPSGRWFGDGSQHRNRLVPDIFTARPKFYTLFESTDSAYQRAVHYLALGR
jgi:C-terminal processing protease CtpA/Prc